MANTFFRPKKSSHHPSTSGQKSFEENQPTRPHRKSNVSKPSLHPPLLQESFSCRPPIGKTYLTIGQDYFSIQEYVQSQYNASLHRTIETEKEIKPEDMSEVVSLKYFYPAATMVYTDIYELRGLKEPADYGSGVEYALGLAEAFPGSGLQIGLWLNGTSGCRDILTGLLDDRTYHLFDFINNILPKSTSKVFLRVGYEFDNPWFGYSDDPTLYQKAFRRMVEKCEDQLGYKICHERVAFVWHSWAAPRIVKSLDAFYPGNDIIDWIGVSIFQQLYPWANAQNNGNFAGGNFSQVIEVLDFARGHRKPIMIAESTPFGGFNVASTEIAKEYTDNMTNIWDLWFQRTLDLIEEYDISMWSYINCDWDTQPMWQGTGFGDTRISSSKLVMEKWWENIIRRNNSRFVNRIENCNFEATNEESLPNSLQWTTASIFLRQNKRNSYVSNTINVIVSTVVLSIIVVVIFVIRRHKRLHHRTNALIQQNINYNYGSIQT